MDVPLKEYGTERESQHQHKTCLNVTR